MHLVGKADAQMIHQRRTLGRVRRLRGVGCELAEIDVDAQSRVERGRCAGAVACRDRAVRGVVAEVDVDLAVPVDRAFLDEAEPLGFLGRELRLDLRRAGQRLRLVRQQRVAARQRGVEGGLELLGEQVAIEVAQGLAVERFGVRRQQLGEEFLLCRLRPADQRHAFVQGFHQARQLHQKRLAKRRRAFRLHAHHEIGRGAPPRCVRSAAGPSRRTASASAWLQTWARKTRR
jgi:hypothetical protein